MKSAFAILLAALLLGGCASNQAYKEGQRLLAEGHTDEGLQQLQLAVKQKPDDLEIRATYVRLKDAEIQRLLATGDAALAGGRFDAAEAAYRKALELHPEDARAPASLAAVETARKDETLMQEAEQAIQQDKPELAQNKLRVVLAQEPNNIRARALLKQAEIKAGKPQGVMTPQMDDKFRKSITLEFRDAPLRSVFDAISRQSGINFVLDKDVRTDAKVTIYARDTAILDTVDMVLSTSQLNRKVLSGNTLLIYPNTPVKQRDYQELVVKSFFLANADAKTTLNLVKTIAKTKDVFIDEKLNLLIARDTPKAMRLIEKLIAVQDQPEPEVMLDVEVLEVTRSKLLELGVQWPSQLSVLNVIPNTSVVAGAVGAPVSTTTTVASTLPLTLNQILLNNLKKSSNIAVNTAPQLNLNATDGDVNLLANPRIRVRNHEKAKIHIGDKVPVITSNVTSTGVTSESVSYLDVGIKLDVEPQVYLEGDVGIKIGLEVSNIVQQVKTATGTLTYQLGSRNADTSLRLKDGETQVLAGLISDQDRSSANKVPLLGDLPLLGHLFSSNSDSKNKSEIVLLITPHIVRNIQRPDLAQSEFFAGTEAEVSDQPLQLRPASSQPPRLPQTPMQPFPLEAPPPVLPTPQDAPPPVLLHPPQDTAPPPSEAPSADGQPAQGPQ